MKELTEGAFAKVNLTLDVLDKREDGYHNLRSIMQTVSLHDDVHVTVGCEGWQIHCYREVLPPDADENTEPELVTCGLPQDRENLAWKAAEAFYARIGKKPEGLEIFINKRIPLEAGLGGGSADAAAVLRALNRAYDSPLSIPALCELGAQVGSDVPFCVMGGTALVEGKGELLTRLPPAPEFFVVICKPDFSVSTPELYQALDETFIEKRPDQKVMQLNLQKGDLLGIGGQIQPDFPALPATQMLFQRNVVGTRGEKNRAVQTLGIAVRHGNGAGGTGGEPGGQGGLSFLSRLLKIQHQTAAFQPLQDAAQPGIDRADGVCIG